MCSAIPAQSVARLVGPTAGLSEESPEIRRAWDGDRSDQRGEVSFGKARRRPRLPVGDRVASRGSRPPLRSEEPSRHIGDCLQQAPPNGQVFSASFKEAAGRGGARADELTQMGHEIMLGM